MTIIEGVFENFLAGKRLVAIGVSLIVLLTLIAYWPSLQGSWLVDDVNYIVENPHLRDGTGLKNIWTDLKANKQFYPLVFTSFWLDFQIWGLEPLGYRLVNLFQHLLNSMLVWWLLRYLGLRWAWLAAVVFAVHPAHVESVAWIVERKNTLSTLFYLIAMGFYLRFALARNNNTLDGFQSPAKGNPWHYFLAMTAFALALFSKTSVATLPGALLVLVWWKKGRIHWADVWPLLPLTAMGLGMGLVTVWLERTNVGASGGIFDISFAARVQVAGTAVWHYVVTVFWPFALSFDYGRWQPGPGNLKMWLGPLGVAVVLICLWLGRHRLGRGPLTGVLFFLGTVFPALGFFNLFFFRYSFVADHFLYPASLGLIGLGVGLVGRVSLKGIAWGRLAVLFSAVVMAGLVSVSWRQSHAYSDMSSLCHSILARNPASWLAHNNLGDQLMKEGRLDESLQHLERAEALAPDRLETQLNLAIVQMNLGHLVAAKGHAERALVLGPEVKFGYNILGEIYLRTNDPGAAASEFERALTLDDIFTKARVNLGSALARLGRFNEAVVQLERAVGEDPGSVVARSNLGIALINLKRYEEAVAQFEAALQRQPDNSALRRNLSQAKVLAEGNQVN